MRYWMPAASAARACRAAGQRTRGRWTAAAGVVFRATGAIARSKGDGCTQKAAGALARPQPGSAADVLVEQPGGSKDRPTIRPSRASTSRTNVPFARPPMLGLQLISPMLAAGEGVTRMVRAPRRAAAAAASVPACPPPTTTTSHAAVAPTWPARELRARRQPILRLPSENGPPADTYACIWALRVRVCELISTRIVLRQE